MLDPWIIEEILKQEEKHKRREEVLHIDLPLEPHPQETEKPKEESNRGVVVIDI